MSEPISDEQVARVRARIEARRMHADWFDEHDYGGSRLYIEDAGALLAEVDRLRAENAFLLHAIDDDHIEAMHRDAEVAAMRPIVEAVADLGPSYADIDRVYPSLNNVVDEGEWQVAMGRWEKRLTDLSALARALLAKEAQE